jgi:hypothetical protein
LQPNSALAVAQLSCPKVDFEDSEAHAIWQRVSHGARMLVGAILTSLLPAMLPSK